MRLIRAAKQNFDLLVEREKGKNEKNISTEEYFFFFWNDSSFPSGRVNSTKVLYFYCKIVEIFDVLIIHMVYCKNHYMN